MTTPTKNLELKWEPVKSTMGAHEHANVFRATLKNSCGYLLAFGSADKPPHVVYIPFKQGGGDPFEP